MSRTISGVNGQISLNPATDDPTYVTGTISAPVATALYAPSGATWTITNTGSISAPNPGGIGVNVSSTGTLINGPSSGGSGYILGGSGGVLFSSAVGTVVNFGKIEAAGDYSYGVDLTTGGAITNGSTGATGALIAAYGKYVTGIHLDGGGTIRNFGTIHGGTGSTNGSYGIVSTGGGTIVNGASGSTAALITGSEEGLHLNDTLTTTVINYGTINGGGLDAIRELSSGNLTVVNFGLLSGGIHAILFGNGTNRLIVHPGAAFQGDVATNPGGVLTIELAAGSGSGTIGGFGSNFTGFKTLTVDSGAQWTITGSNSLASGTTLTDSGTLINSGTLANSGTLIDAGTLVNAGKIIGGVTLNTAALLSVTSSGSVNNNGTGKAIFGGIATVVNDGKIVATGANAGYGYQGIYLGGGSVNNTGMITASGNAIVLQGAGTITNSGTVSGGRWGATSRGFTTLINSGTLYGASQGVVLSAGGYINNSNTISGLDGIGIGGTSGTVVNSGAITGTYGAAIFLSSGGTVNNSASGLITAGGIYTGVDISGAAGMVTNAGTITGYTGIGIDLTAGGTVTNGFSETEATGDTTSGSNTVTNLSKTSGIAIGDAVAGPGIPSGTTVTNIIGSSVSLSSSATVTGSGIALTFTASALIAGAKYGVVIASSGTIDNRGTLSGTSTLGVGAYLYSGSLTNGASGSASGLITGGAGAGLTADELAAVAFKGGGTLTNFGTLITADPLGAGARFAAGGLVTNGPSGATGALIEGGNHGIVFQSGAGTVVNFGTIAGNQAVGVGIALGGGGTITNGAVGSTAALISGVRVGIGLNFNYASTIFNYGTITGQVGIGPPLGGSTSGTASQTVVDSGTIIGSAATAIAFGAGDDLLKLIPGPLLIQGTASGGGGTNTLEFASAASKGTLTGVGADFVGFTTGTVDAGASWVLAGTNTLGVGVTLTNSGTLEVSGTLINAGAIGGAEYSFLLAPGGYFENLSTAGITRTGSGGAGFAPVIDGLAGGAGTISNFGAITNSAGNAGIYMQGGGTVTNGAGGLILGSNAVYGYNAGLTVINSGTIEGNPGIATSVGIALAAGGVVSNNSTAGLIRGQEYGVTDTGGTVSNFGTILAISADGIRIGAAGTIIDHGTITAGRYSVRMLGGNELLKLYPGAVLTGVAIATGTGNILELASSASAGTITGLGASFYGFGAIKVDVGAQWTIIGSNSIASGVTLSDLGTLTNTGSLTGLGSLVVDPATLVNSGSIGLTATLSGGGYLDNAATGTIAAAGPAVYGTIAAPTIFNAGLIVASSGPAIVLGAGGTVTDAGTIGGVGTAISFGGSGANLLIVEHGYTLTGGVSGSGSAGATNTLELVGSAASPLTANYNSLSLSNFGTVKFAPGADYVTLKITSNVTLPGTIAGFTAPHDVVDLTALSDAGNDATASLDTLTNVLTVAGDNGSVQLQLDSENYSGLAFSAQNDGGNGTKVTVFADTTPPVTTPASLTVAENAASTAIGITAPSDPDNPVSALTVKITGLPSDGTVASGGTTVTLNQVLTVAQLTALTFTPATNIFGQSSSLSYTVTDPAGNSVTGSATLAIGADNTPPVTISASLTVAENEAATAIGIAAPSDPDNPAAALTVTITGLPSDGTVMSGGAAVSLNQTLTVAQLTALTFTPTANTFSQSSNLSYTVADAAGNSVTGGASLAIGADNTPPVTIAASLSVAENAAATAIGIAAPSDPDNAASTLTVKITGLPSDGTVASGGTALTLSQILTVAQLTALTFTPTPDAVSQNSSLSYTVADSAGNTVTGMATLAIGLDTTPPVTVPASLSVAENAAATAIGIAAPSDPDNAASTLTVTITGLPSDGTVMSGGTAVSLNQVLTVAQLTALTFTPAANTFGQSSSLSYMVADPAGNSTAGSASLAIGADNTAPTTTPASLGVAENAAATAIGIAAPSDPDNPAAALTVKITGLPSDGTVMSGGIAVTLNQTLTVAQLTALTFTPTANIFGQSSSLGYTVADAAGNSVTGSASLAIGADITAPSTTAASLTVAENAAATAIGITAPSDPDNAVSTLTVTVTGLPSDGTVMIGNTALTLNQILTTAQLTALTFTPADNAFSQSSSLGYTVADAAGNSVAGSATLAIGAQMASPTGGRFIIGPPAGFTSVTASINDGIDPVFPTPVSGNFNIEVFTAAGVTTLPALDSGFQAGIIDPGGDLVAPGFLTGTTLRLFTGDYAVTDSVTGATQTAADIILGSGSQTVTGGSGDTLQGGSGSQLLIGGSGPTTVFGAPGDLVVAGAGSTYIDGTAGKMAIGVGSGRTDSIVGTFSINPVSGPATGPDTIFGGAAAVKIQGLGKGDLISFGDQTGDSTINATIGNIAATLGGGAATVFGGQGDTITLGSVGQYADGGAGNMTIQLGTAGVDSVFGSNVAGGGDTIIGGSATLSFNLQGGGGDLINLAGSSGNATINGFSAAGTQLASVNDTIMAGSGSDSVWGGPGDRIGVGTSTTAGGTHLFDHSTSIAGAAMSFGTNDSVADSSTAKVTVTNFNLGTDSLFYQNENAATNASIIATSTTTGGNTTFTLPDGTLMTLIGVASINSGMFKP